ncbi:DUF3558 domain-containing protein [Nocardia huaxiensis]|uniref:DUF3558 domain-containing protein n=1 Tax=Nocardia huaxiensis TaxID=2755382 RepID=A0A7D6VDF3_9NOCA|nr:DUF3558 domain-containing protein [Nocardia huaxiensis]
MRLASAIVTGVSLALLLSACGGNGDGDDSPTGVRTPPKVATLGPFVGECGHVTDDEIRQISGVSGSLQVYRNSVGCHWKASGSSAEVTFASYRGSPLAREQAWESLQGRNPEAITVAGKPGFQAYAISLGGELCDFAVQLDDDFFEWSFAGPVPAGQTACTVSRQFAELTMQRLG